MRVQKMPDSEWEVMRAVWANGDAVGADLAAGGPGRLSGPGFSSGRFWRPSRCSPFPRSCPPYGAAASLPPFWALTMQDAKGGTPLVSTATLSIVWLMGALAAVVFLLLRQRRFLSALRRTATLGESPRLPPYRLRRKSDRDLRPDPPPR